MRGTQLRQPLPCIWVGSEVPGLLPRSLHCLPPALPLPWARPLLDAHHALEGGSIAVWRLPREGSWQVGDTMRGQALSCCCMGTRGQCVGSKAMEAGSSIALTLVHPEPGSRPWPCHSLVLCRDPSPTPPDSRVICGLLTVGRGQTGWQPVAPMGLLVFQAGHGGMAWGCSSGFQPWLSSNPPLGQPQMWATHGAIFSSPGPCLFLFLQGPPHGVAGRGLVSGAAGLRGPADGQS